MSKASAIRTFFGNVSNRELIDFLRGDPDGFDEIAMLCAEALGVTITTTDG